MSKRIIIRHTHAGDAHVSDAHAAEPTSKTNAICKEARYWEDPAYRRYIQMHGEHFTRKLSEWACKEMTNRNCMEHYWTPEQVEAVMSKMGVTLDAKTKYDAHYLANMAYADYFGSTFVDETKCLQFAADYMADPDGYEGRAFNHWLTDAMKKCITIDWDRF